MALTLGDNFSYGGSKPLDARLKYSTLADMKAVADSTMYDGCMAYCVATDKTYQWKSGNTVDADTGKWREFSSGGAEITVDDEISSTSENPVQNKVIKGALDDKADLVSGKVPASQLPSYVDDIINGYYYNGAFYEEDTHTTPIVPETDKIYLDLETNKFYRWSGALYAEVSESLALGETSSTAYRGDRGKIAYDISQTVGDVDDLDTTDKSSVVDAINELVADKQDTDDIMTAADMDDVVTPLPSVMSRRFKYSTEEQVVGEWIDGKPLYQKTIDCGTLPNNERKNVPTGITNGLLVDGVCVIRNSTDGGAVILQRYNDTINWAVGFYCNSINITTTEDRTAWTALATIQYTKTTD